MSRLQAAGQIPARKFQYLVHQTLDLHHRLLGRFTEPSKAGRWKPRAQGREQRQGPDHVTQSRKADDEDAGGGEAGMRGNGHAWMLPEDRATGSVDMQGGAT